MSGQFGLGLNNPGVSAVGPNFAPDGQSHHGHGASLSLGGGGGGPPGAFGLHETNGQASNGTMSPVENSVLSKPREGQVRRGICKFFNSQKGFGFVLDNNSEELGGQEVFVHFTAIQSRTGFRSLAEGEEVEYEITTGPKGFQASRLTGPGGRPVMGDPKARLMKQPQFMQLAPIAFPGPYGMDPYVQQHPGAVYAASPYNLVYVPTQPGQTPQFAQVLSPGGQFNPQMSGNFNASGRNAMMGGGGQPQNPMSGAYQTQGGPSSVFGPVGGMASTMGGGPGYQQQPQQQHQQHLVAHPHQSPFGNVMSPGGGGNAAVFGGPARYATGLGQLGSGPGGNASSFVGGGAGGLGLGNPGRVNGNTGPDDGGFVAAFGNASTTDSTQQGLQHQQEGSNNPGGVSASSAFFGSGNLLYSSN